MTIHRPPTQVRVRDAAPDDITLVAGVLADAFLDDPVFSWCLPDSGRRGSVLPAFFELATAAVLPHREVQTTAGGEGAALWVPPGRPPVAEADAPAFEERLAGLLGDEAERTFAIMALLDEHHPTEEHRFLWFVGVRAGERGNGIGSALLRTMLAQCDREGVAAYLDATSEHNRRLYERHGFEVIAEQSVDGSPPLWGMWREPIAAG